MELSHKYRTMYFCIIFFVVTILEQIECAYIQEKKMPKDYRVTPLQPDALESSTSAPSIRGSEAPINTGRSNVVNHRPTQSTQGSEALNNTGRSDVVNNNHPIQSTQGSEALKNTGRTVNHRPTPNPISSVFRPPQTNNTIHRGVETPDNRKSLLIGFLPALTANKGQSKHFVGAFRIALNDVNTHLLNTTEYRLDYMVRDNKADTLESLRGMTEQYMAGAVAFIGPEDTCEHEAKLAVAWNLPMIAFKCRNSAVSNRNGSYPTFIRTIPSTFKVSKSLIALMVYFKWTSFQAVVGNSSHWKEAANTLRQRSEVAKIHMNPDVLISEPYIGTNEMPKIVEQTSKLTRSL